MKDRLRLSTIIGCLFNRGCRARKFASSKATSNMTSLQQFVTDTIVSNDFEWAWENYKSVVLSLQRRFKFESLMEVGGGRSPLINRVECGGLGVKYTVNDISGAELALAPEWCSKACFDISRAPINIDASYDLIFSKMVFEHLSDAKSAYQSVYNLLLPGGICLAFFPTLYCLPFLVNYLLPEKLSRIAQSISDPRNAPKFLAYYNWCRSTTSVKEKIEQIGFREVIICSFYGHNYYSSIPLARDAERQWRKLVQRKDFKMLSSFAFAFMQK
jgi:SAM-dependent methyltransferase